MAQEKLKLLRTKKSLPKWFPLRVYTSELTKEEWLDELAMRVTVKTSLDCGNNRENVKNLFQDLIVDKKYKKGFLVSKNKDVPEIWGIRELSGFDALYLSCAVDNSTQGLLFKNRLQEIIRSKDANAIFNELPKELENQKRGSFVAVTDKENEPFYFYDVLSGFPVKVDLDQDDETLIAAFKVWLAQIREDLGEAKKPIGEKDFLAWKEYGLLQTFDLDFWALLNDSKFTNNVIANAIWPDSEVDTTERLRKVTKPKVEELLTDWRVVRCLARQLEVENAVQSLLKGL